MAAVAEVPFSEHREILLERLLSWAAVNRSSRSLPGDEESDVGPDKPGGDIIPLDFVEHWEVFLDRG